MTSRFKLTNDKNNNKMKTYAYKFVERYIIAAGKMF